MLDGDYAVILAGGKGERFWPMSTERRPKQFLDLFGGGSLLEQSVDRLEGLIPPERVLVITNAELVDAARAAAPRLPTENIIGEPVGRDTAAAVALGLALVRARSPDAASCILTADHVIGAHPRFRATLRECLSLAHTEDVLITIGIQPNEASTSFGYIEVGEALEARDGIGFFRARRFVEKPDQETAEAYLAGGKHFWNGGMFIWSVSALDRALQLYAPALHNLAAKLSKVVDGPGFDRALADAYAPLERISIDYAVMEKADNIVMARGTFPWDDVGSWPAVAHHIDPNAEGNVVIGDTTALDASGNIVVSPGRLTALIGVSDLVVVQAEGVTLVCPKDRAQDIKPLVQNLKESGRHASLL